MAGNAEDQVIDVTDDLDEFSKEFYGKATPAKSEAPETDPEDDVEETPVDDTDETLEDSETDSGEDEVEEAKPRKKTFQDRIDEITAEKYEERRAREAAERRAEELLRRLEEIETRLPKTPEKTEAPAKSGAPQFDAVDENGELVYPLGEFDPKYIADLTRYEVNANMAALREEEERRAAVEAAQKEQQTLTEAWQQKVAEASDALPNFQATVSNLESEFRNLDPEYGTFLAQTIMSMDAGPEVLYYLANNTEEAKAIVAAGAIGATIALGKLEAKLEQRKTNPVKASRAPEPPRQVPRGNSGKFTVADDTDDLEAFEKKFFSR